MKIQNLVSIIILLFSIGTVSADSAISNIRNEYKVIRNELATLKKASKPLSGFSAEGGSVHSYRNANNKIRLIKVELYGESGKSFEEFYYKNDNLIFSYQEDHKYNVPFTVTKELAKEIGIEPFDPKKTKIKENRYYFSGGILIRWIDETKKEVSPKTKEFRDAQENVIKFSNQMFTQFK